MPYPRKPKTASFYTIERGSTSKARKWAQFDRLSGDGGSWAGAAIFTTRASANLCKIKGDVVLEMKKIAEPPPAKSKANR